MTAAEFRNGVMDWLHKYGFTDIVSVSYNLYSSFNMDEHEIRIGTEALHGVDKWFEEFLVERGLEWENIPSPVLQFLHELGHSQTVYEYTDDELMMFHLVKEFTGETDACKESAMQYWKVADELAANNWLVDFANREIDAMKELCQWFIDNWEDSIQSMEEEAWNNYALDAII